MPKTVEHILKFPIAPAELYDHYMDSKKHAAMIGSKAVVSRKVGGRFSAFDGYCFGRNLVLVPGRLIVQTWRASNWRKGNLDSLFMMEISKAPGGCRLHLVHANLPDREAPGIRKGWLEHYWTPLKKQLQART